MYLNLYHLSSKICNKTNHTVVRIKYKNWIFEIDSWINLKWLFMLKSIFIKNTILSIISLLSFWNHHCLLEFLRNWGFWIYAWHTKLPYSCVQFQIFRFVYCIQWTPIPNSGDKILVSSGMSFWHPQSTQIEIDFRLFRHLKN